jgi:hypothetical protein
MAGEIKNLYKRMDVFRCNQGGHEPFENAVSVYHVLRERECYPEGCVWFQWRCRHPRGEKGCARGFSHVGRMCLSCPHFYDEKVLRYPRLLLSSQMYREFLKELRGFEEWLRWLSNREIEVWGTINSVKPHFKEVMHSHGSHVAFQGFLLNFAEVYLDLIHWKDFCFVTLNKGMQSLHRFRKGDQVSFRAKARMDWGRLVLSRVRVVEVESKTEGEFWTESKAHLARRLGASFSDQPERCLGCEKGALLDVVEAAERSERKDRRLFCLEGFSDPGLCSLHAGAELAWQKSGLEKEAVTSEGI